jgi:hypothetical protein
MARPKNIETDELLALLGIYYTNECRANNQLIKIPAFGAYLRSKGYAIQDYSIRRCEQVRNKIEEINRQEESMQPYKVAVFKSLDTDQFLLKNSNVSALKSALIKRDQYYQSVSDSATFAIQNQTKLEEQNKKKQQEIAFLKAELHKSKITISELEEVNAELKKRIQVLNHILRTHVYPDVANELLHQEGILISYEAVDEHIRKDAIISDADSLLDPLKEAEQAKKNNVIRDLFDKI